MPFHWIEMKLIGIKKELWERWTKVLNSKLYYSAYTACRKWNSQKLLFSQPGKTVFKFLAFFVTNLMLLSLIKFNKGFIVSEVNFHEHEKHLHLAHMQVPKLLMIYIFKTRKYQKLPQNLGAGNVAWKNSLNLSPPHPLSLQFIL